MIPLRGTVRIIRAGTGEPITCEVVGVEEGDFLVAAQWWPRGGGRPTVRVERSSDIGTVESFAPQSRVIPAQPGWWARTIWLHDDPDEVEVEMQAVVGWDAGTGEPLVLHREYQAVAPVERAGDGICDAIVYDPAYRPDHPPLAEQSLREHVERERCRVDELRAGREAAG